MEIHSLSAYIYSTICTQISSLTQFLSKMFNEIDYTKNALSFVLILWKNTYSRWKIDAKNDAWFGF